MDVEQNVCTVEIAKYETWIVNMTFNLPYPQTS